MARKARFHNSNETYHIMLRGINRQQIFHDSEDYQQYIKLLGYYKKVSGFTLHAYCLMGNHIHLLLSAQEEPLETIFRRIGSAFVYWYNSKYNRVGHLFQDRYRSESIDTESSFIAVFRYILRNPVAAGICDSAELYPYSSAREYYYSERGITDTRLIFQIMDKQTLRGFLRQENEDKCMDLEDSFRKRYTDTEATKLILREFGTYSPEIGEPKDRKLINDSIKKLIKTGISIRQLSRLTGIPKKIIESALKNNRGDKGPSSSRKR